jgi:hypothetical protein
VLAPFEDLFSMSINASREKGEPMKEQSLLIDLVFKPVEPGLKLRSEETQLLLAHMSEILKEIEEEEEKRIIEEEKTTTDA